MSGERSVDVEKINNNEKGFEPAHIRSVISLALFSFVFLGMEFFFDSRAAGVCGCQKCSVVSERDTAGQCGGTIHICTD